VRALTFEYESSPLRIACEIAGSFSIARATRTFSRAAPRASPVRQLSQWAQEAAPQAQPLPRSNSAIIFSKCQVAASIWAESTAIFSPRMSTGRASGSRVAGISLGLTSGWV
jgi:hypothetical protein